MGSLKSSHDTQQIMFLEQKMRQQQKQQLLEQQIKIQSLSDHQMLTQKQIAEAHQQIQQTQQVTQHVTENVQSLHQRQQQQATHQQLTEQQIQQQLQEQAQQLHTQQQLSQLAQAHMGQSQFNIPPPPQPPSAQPQPQPQPVPNSNGGWLPSFFVFNKTHAPNTSHQDMDLAPSPPLRPMQQVDEEKANILMDDDDEDVLGWHNDYGHQQSPLMSNPALLKTKGVIGKGKFSPNDKRQCGWILHNQSKVTLKLRGRLECIGGAQEQHGIKVLCEKMYEFSLKPGEEVYILIEVEAPSVCGKYCAFYQLVLANGAKVGELLEVTCEVEGAFTEKRERKIAQIIKMGFADRKKVVATLQRRKWNVQQSINELIKQ